MFGQKHRLTSLESRKQLLVLESELNRAHLHREFNELKVEVNDLAQRLFSASTIAKLIADVISSFGNNGSNSSNNSGEEKQQRGGFFRLGNLARFAAGVYHTFRSRNS